MKCRHLATLLTLAAFALPAHADLAVGEKAPDFTLEASLAGEAFSFSLADALSKGPVVVYFYPKSFTKGCTVEAHEFAEATPEFEAMHATLIGISTDDLETQKKFSVEECRNKFAVAADPDAAVTKAYDATFEMKPSLADRTSYVIAPDGTILLAYTDLSPKPHIEKALEAVKAWDAKNAGS